MHFIQRQPFELTQKIILPAPRIREEETIVEAPELELELDEPTVTDEQIDEIVNAFITGNSTRAKAEVALEELGIICNTGDTQNDRVLEFTYNNKTYHIECARAAADDGRGGNVVETITPEKVDELVSKYGEDVTKYFKAVAKTNDEVTAYALNFENWPEGVNKTIASLETYLDKPKETEAEKALQDFLDELDEADQISGDDFKKLMELVSAATGKEAQVESHNLYGIILTAITFDFNGYTYSYYTNAEVFPQTFTENDLEGISAEDISRYFNKSDDGKYTFNTENIKTDFPDMNITSIDDLKQAINDKKSKVDFDEYTDFINLYKEVEIPENITTYDNANDAHNAINAFASNNYNALEEYYKENGGEGIFGRDVWGSIMQAVHGSYSTYPCSFTEDDIINIAKSVIDDKVAKEKEAKTPTAQEKMKSLNGQHFTTYESLITSIKNAIGEDNMKYVTLNVEVIESTGAYKVTINYDDGKEKFSIGPNTISKSDANQQALVEAGLIQAPEPSDSSALTKDVLQNKYHLTELDISRFFTSKDGAYEINNNSVHSCFGKQVKDIDELLVVLKTGLYTQGYVYGAYSMSSEKYTQYLIKSGEGNNIRFKLDLEKIAKDFPGQEINTLGQLKEAVNKQAQTPEPETTTPPAPETTTPPEQPTVPPTEANTIITDTDKTSILNQVKADAVSNGIDGIKLTEEEAETLLSKLNEDSDIKNFTGTKEQFTTLVNAKAKTYAEGIVAARTPQDNNTGTKTDLDTFVNTFDEIDSFNVKADIETILQDINDDCFDADMLASLEEYGVEITITKDTDAYIATLKHGNVSYQIEIPNEMKDELNATGLFETTGDKTLDTILRYQVTGFSSYQDMVDKLGSNIIATIAKDSAKEVNNKYVVEVTYNNKKYSLELYRSNNNRDALIQAGLMKDEVTNADKNDILKDIKNKAISSDTYGQKLTSDQADILYAKLSADSDLAAFTGAKSAFIDKATEKAKSYIQEILADKTEDDKKPENAAKNAIDALTKNDNSAVRGNRISSTINSLEAEYAAKHNQNTKVNTAYSIDAYGNISFKDAFVKTMYNDLFAHIKEVIGTDGFDEKTLKQLYQTSWEMTYSSYPSNQENDISDFLNKVYSNFKQVLSSIQSKPEYLDIFTGKTANGNSTSETRAVNGAKQGAGGGYVLCDRNANVYGDGSVHVSNNASDANLQKAVSSLKSKIQSLYANIPQSTLNSLINNAVKKAVENIGNGRTEEIPKNFAISGNQTYANTIADLALYYFEQALYNLALTDNTLLSGNSAQSPAVETTVTDDEKAKWTKAKDSINNSLDDIYDSSHIKGFLMNHNVSGNRATNMYISSTGDLKFNNTDVQKAYDDFFKEMWSKSGIKNSGITETEFKNIYKAAWINTYNGINNMSYNNMENVFERVVKNIKNITSKLATNPEYMTIINNASNVARSVTNSTTTINYDNTDTNLNYGDGNVHLGDDNSDKQYQAAINILRTTLKNNYVPPMSESQFNTWFTQAQKNAIDICGSNSSDILFGLECDGWSREGDDWEIYIGELMHLITYQFDKLMYKGIFGAE